MRWVPLVSQTNHPILAASLQIWETYPDGKPLYGNVSPEGHADIAFKLVQSAEQSENEVPFVVKDGKAQRAPKDLKFVVDW